MKNYNSTHNNGFEKQVQQKMEELKFTPSDILWQKIEAGLDKKNKPRPLVFIFILLSLILTSAIYFLYKNSVSRSYMQTLSQNPSIQIFEKTGILTPVNAALSTNSSVTKNNSPLSYFIQPETGLTGNISLNKQEDISITKENTEKQVITIPARTKIKIYRSGEDASIVNEQVQEEPDKKINIVTDAEATSLTPDSLFIVAEKEKKNLPITLKEATHPDNSDTLIKNRKTEKGWEWKIMLAPGISNAKNTFLTNTILNILNTNPTAQPSTVSGGFYKKPSSSWSFKAGISLQKKISKKWSLGIGLQYAYLSSIIKVGKKVDSAVVFQFGNMLVSANHFYRNGTMDAYKNNYHFIEMPLLLQYNVFKNAKLPVYIEGGGTLAYLAGSNALIYERRHNSYVSAKSTFNKWIFSLHAGAGIRLAQKSKLPFSIGYSLNYSLNSILKKPFNNHYLINSSLQLQFPFKK